MNYLTKKKIFHQSGFYKNHSRNTTLSFLANKILTGFDSGLLTGIILIDLQQASATINRNILHYVCSKYLTIWCKLYLSNRSFQINIDKKCSCIAKIDCVITPGSILGPLPFPLEVNDIN